MDYVEIKKQIVKGIEEARQAGITLVCNDWGDKQNKCACALGCLLLEKDILVSGDSDQNKERAAHLLGVSQEWVESFYYGFDNLNVGGAGVVEAYPDAYHLGKQLREESGPVTDFDYYMLNNQLG